MRSEDVLDTGNGITWKLPDMVVKPHGGSMMVGIVAIGGSTKIPANLGLWTRTLDRLFLL